MIKEAVEYLQTQLTSTHLFTKVWGLCELINKDSKTYPAFYKGGGNYDDVSQFDRQDGTAYFRMLSDVTTDNVEPEFITTSCGALIEFNFSLRVVCVIKRDKLECDDAYGVHQFAQMIAKVIDTSSGLGTSLNAVSAKAIVKRYSTNGHEILKQEYQNPSINEFNFNFAYLSLDVDLIIIKDKNCIDAICY